MLRPGVIAKKVGMSAVFLEDGRRIPVTLLHFENCCVLAHKKDSENNRFSVQVSSGFSKRISKPLKGQYEKAGIHPRRSIKEFPVSEDALLPVGSLIVPSYFPEGNFVDVVGKTLGKGFAGAMKRHNFGGLRASHGVSVSHRSHGSTGNRKDPGRVFKGKKMAGHLGCEKITMQNLQIIAADDELGILVVKGSVPGFAGCKVVVKDALKKRLLQSISLPDLKVESLLKDIQKQDIESAKKEEGEVS